MKPINLCSECLHEQLQLSTKVCACPKQSSYEDKAGSESFTPVSTIRIFECRGEWWERDNAGDAVWRIVVFQEQGGPFAAEFTSADGKIGGMGNYANTVVGALAELCATFIKMNEDEAKS
jgi:hypothetical protein